MDILSNFLTSSVSDIQIDDQARYCKVDLDPLLPYFEGHFPGQPILPAAIALEASVLLIGSLFDVSRPRLREALRSKFPCNLLAGERVEVKITQKSEDSYRVQWQKPVSGETSELAIDLHLSVASHHLGD